MHGTEAREVLITATNARRHSLSIFCDSARKAPPTARVARGHSSVAFKVLLCITRWAVICPISQRSTWERRSPTERWHECTLAVALCFGTDGVRHDRDPESVLQREQIAAARGPNSYLDWTRRTVSVGQGLSRTTCARNATFQVQSSRNMPAFCPQASHSKTFFLQFVVM